VLALHGADDPIAPRAQVDSFMKEMSDAEVDWQVVLYADTDHGFTAKRNISAAKSTGSFYNEKTDKPSWAAMQDLLRGNTREVGCGTQRRTCESDHNGHAVMSAPKPLQVCIMSAFAQTLPGAGGRLVCKLGFAKRRPRNRPIDPSFCQPLTEECSRPRWESVF
jgi:hypothetical protein